MILVDNKYCLNGITFPNSHSVGVVMSCNCTPSNNNMHDHVHTHHDHHSYHDHHHSCCCDNEYEHTSSQAAEYNFCIQKGTTLDLDIEYKDANNNPVNLTGYTVTCIAQYKTKTFTINAKVQDACCGCINLYMSPYETSRIFTLDTKYSNYTEYSYVLNLKSPGNVVYRILNGTISVSPEAGS